MIGLLGGLALGLVGALMQGVTRNPIADPGLLGINSGASLMVIVAITWFEVANAGGYVWFASTGAAIAGLVVYGAASLGWEGVTPVKLALVGAALTAVATSLITLVLLVDHLRVRAVGGREGGAVRAGGVGLGQTASRSGCGSDEAMLLSQTYMPTGSTSTIMVPSGQPSVTRRASVNAAVALSSAVHT